MDIHLVSTLTADDEARIGAAVCAAAGAVLDSLGIAYTLRIETADGQVFRHYNVPDPIEIAAQRSTATT